MFFQIVTEIEDTRSVQEGRSTVPMMKGYTSIGFFFGEKPLDGPAAPAFVTDAFQKGRFWITDQLARPGTQFRGTLGPSIVTSIFKLS